MQKILAPATRRLLFLCLCWPLLATAADPAEINYDAETDILSVDIRQQPLADVLAKISAAVGFKLSLEGADLSAPVSYSGQARSADLINQLVRPNSAVLSQSETAPHPVTSLYILPAGNQDTVFVQRRMLKPPEASDDPVKHAENIAKYERRLKRHAEGFGRRNPANNMPPVNQAP